MLPKIDWKVSNNHQLAVTYNRLRWDSPAGVQTAAVVNRGVESWGNDSVHGDWATARFSSVLGSRMTNEVKFQWGRDFEFQSSQDPLPGEPVSHTGRTPAVDITGASGISFGKPNFLERRSYPDERRVDVGDVVTWWGGSHLVKFGANVSRVSDTLDNLFQEGGVYAYGSRVDFISDYEANVKNAAAPSRFYTSFNQGVGPTAFSFRTFDFDAFVQDTWHATSRTTLNLGLRYDYEKMPKPQIPNALLPATSVFPKDRNNFGPRLGVAYDLTGTGNTVVRGGYGMFYGRIINSTISNAITNVGSGDGQLALQLQNTAAGAPTFPNILAERLVHAGAAGRGRLRGQRAEPARARVRPHPRASHRGQHPGVGVLRRQRGPQPAAVHRREPAGALGHGDLPDHSAGRSTARRRRCRCSPAHVRTRTSAASRPFPGW